MSGWRRARATALLLVASLLATPRAELRAQAAPPASPAARTDTAASTVPGSELEIYVMTMGQGDLLWERFGHNALGVRNLATGSDVVYNWGTFSFEQPGFLPRFLRGEMLYWLAPNDAAQTLEAYQYFNRSVTVQRLNLTPAQRDSVRKFVEWNARDENKFYHYDYYRDNCSTRVRDALDLVLGGALRAATDTQRTAMTYRDHSLRLTDGMFWWRTGIDFGLGAPTDHPISAWQAMFIPMELQRRLRDIRVPDANGMLIPLVASENVLFQASRPPERMDVPSLAGIGLVIGLVTAGILLALGYRTPGRIAALSLTTLWSWVAGIFGLLLFLLWAFTSHTAAHGNQNLFFAHPLWLAVAVMLPFARRSRATRNRLLLIIRICTGVAILGGLVALTPFGQPSGEIAAFAVPVIVAVYLLVLRVVYLAQQESNAKLPQGTAGRPARA